MKRIRCAHAHLYAGTTNARDKEIHRQCGQVRHLLHTHLITGLLIAAILLSQALFPLSVRADDADGQITILRTIPPHDAFRRGDVGTPTNVSTAPEALSDTAMGAVDGQGQSVDGVPGANRAMTGSLATTPENTGSPINNNRAQVLSGGAGVADTIIHGLAPLNRLANIMPGAR